jgi:hypothetical protein
VALHEIGCQQYKEHKETEFRSGLRRTQTSKSTNSSSRSLRAFCSESTVHFRAIAVSPLAVSSVAIPGVLGVSTAAFTPGRQNKIRSTIHPTSFSQLLAPILSAFTKAAFFEQTAKLFDHLIRSKRRWMIQRQANAAIDCTRCKVEAIQPKRHHQKRLPKINTFVETVATAMSNKHAHVRMSKNTELGRNPVFYPHVTGQNFTDRQERALRIGQFP